ncbi:hypothetical protein [Candidatus Solincola sp.]|nr:hypothetical protein [Actinomycetota bacterium]MDI7251762.1 hypothetical protein [Actinomycetota bacterium]
MAEIAVLGWDPMVTEPEGLMLRDGRWLGDGPVLPVELSRVAPQRYLALSLRRGSTPVQVYWSLMGTDSVGEAVWSLAQRAECKPENVGFLDLATGEHWCRTVDECLPDIRRWAEEKNREGHELRVVIWNDLRPDFERRTRRDLTPENVLAYLRGLRPEVKEKALDYLRKIPPRIRTPILDAVREVLDDLR